MSQSIESLVGTYGYPVIAAGALAEGGTVIVVAPLAIGASSVRAGRFALLNLAGAVSWTLTFGVGGYLFGAAFEAFLGDLRHYETEAVAALALVGAAVGIFHRVRRRRRDAL